MKLTFANGTELEVLGVHGRTISYEGVQRDSLIFLMDPEAVSLAQAVEVFTPENCKTMQITDETGTYLHENYTIRVEVGQGYKDFALTGGVDGRDMTQRTYVRMAQSTMAERQMQSQQEQLDEQADALIELAGIVAGGAE